MPVTSEDLTKQHDLDTWPADQLWTPAEAEESMRLAYDHAADLFTWIIGELPEDRFKSVDGQMLAETADAVVTINLSARTLKVGMAPAGSAAPAELFDAARTATAKDCEIAPFAPREAVR
jgi:hypothetical protein